MSYPSRPPKQKSSDFSESRRHSVPDGRSYTPKNRQRRPDRDTRDRQPGRKPLQGGLEARLLAWQVLGQVIDNRRSFQPSLHAAWQKTTLSARDRAFVYHLTSTALRRRGQIDLLLSELVNRPRRVPSKIFNLLRLGVVQALWSRVPPHALTNTARQLLELEGETNWLPVVGAVLARILEEGQDRIAEQDENRDNMPGWLWQKCCETYGEVRTRRLVSSCLQEPPLDITLKDCENRREWADRLKAIRVGTRSLRRENSSTVDSLPGYAEGAWWVQDLAASLPIRLFGSDLQGCSVLDLCAAPGGKTAQLCAAGAQVTAVDREEKRCARLRDNLKRLSLDAHIICADIRSWQPDQGQKFDRILLDAPCSAMGTLRRHPDIIWNKDMQDVQQLQAIQREFVTRAASFASDQGRIVLATCSLLPEEGEEMLAPEFLDQIGWEIDPVLPAEFADLPVHFLPRGAVQTLPDGDPGGCDMDGFFMARLRKKQA